jgi:glycogen synthase
VLTHNLNNYDEDPINRRIHQLSFTNDVNSMLSVIYVPCYLNGTDGIFNKSYYELLPGLDATVFSSYYEPWGYTPLESIAFGVPTITTTLAGFGQWVLSTAQNEFSACGVHVHDRTDSNYDMVCNAIAHDIICLMDLSDKEISKVRKAAMNMSDTAGWNSFISYYVEAYKIAINKVTQLI